jgi:hypothetical protein
VNAENENAADYRFEQSSITKHLPVQNVLRGDFMRKASPIDSFDAADKNNRQQGIAHRIKTRSHQLVG